MKEGEKITLTAGKTVMGFSCWYWVSNFGMHQWLVPASSYSCPVAASVCCLFVLHRHQNISESHPKNSPVANTSIPTVIPVCIYHFLIWIIAWSSRTLLRNGASLLTFNRFHLWALERPCHRSRESDASICPRSCIPKLMDCHTKYRQTICTRTCLISLDFSFSA